MGHYIRGLDFFLDGGFLRLLGEVQVRYRQFENALDNLFKAIGIIKEVGNPRQLWEAHASVAAAFSSLGRFSEARDQSGAAAEVIQNVAAGLTERELREDLANAQPIRAILSRAAG